MWKEFKAFALRGNMVDMAVGIIIGASFGGLVQSLVKDLIMPPIGLFTGGIDFTNKFWVLKAGKDGLMQYATLADATKAGAVTLNYGLFVTLVVNFLIVSLAVFLLVRVIQHFYKRQESTDKTPTKEQELLTEIRDLLKSR